MQCPECQSENREGAKFCSECGHKFELSCPKCGNSIKAKSKFCDECGYKLESPLYASKTATEIKSQPPQPADTGKYRDVDPITSERKYVTVLFSDLTGYTEMSERLDPEEVKEITGSIFSELTRIIEKYDGFIEKYVGDAVLAVFGAVKAFEDSALRAIKAAREIHAHVESISPKYEDFIGRQLSMHTGINSGLVVTGDINFQKGTHGLVGDTINTAARLMSVSKAGEIVVDRDSFIQTQGYFDFEALEPVKLKGKADPIQAYRVGKALKEPKKLHRLYGLRAELIGRSIEMQVLEEAAEKLLQGQGSVIAVCGTAGTGKSRLIFEVKKRLDLKKVQWFDANAYPYTQNTPYYPLIDLLAKAFRIEEGDKAGDIKRKVESGLEALLCEGSDKIPFIGGLFSIEYPETSDVSPEYWKTQLFAAVREIIKALTESGPTVICMEDIHWADPSFMELIRKLISDLAGPLLLICIYRPSISFLTDFETQTLKIDFRELRLKDLSSSETQSMVSSLLKDENIPKDLRRFIHDRVEGNPFYVEELINSLIESEALSNRSGNWELTGTIDELTVSTNIQGVIAGRIDRLGRDTKRILQEASVIGRAFLFDILQRISEIEEGIDKNLMLLERLDLIKAKSIQPTLEYIFKHALTQEIVYNGLVRSEKRSIHEKIGNVIEFLFQDRLSEFYETLAFHYARGKSALKAVDYLIKSGEKCLKRYAINESHEYFENAFKIINAIPDRTEAHSEMLIDLLNKWSMVYYYRGDFFGIVDLLIPNQKIAEAISNKEQLGMFYAWLGWGICQSPLMPKEVDTSRNNVTKIALDYLEKSLLIGEENKSLRVECYARTWLSWLLADMGSFENGIDHGRKAHQIALELSSEHYLFYKSLAGIGWNYIQMGHADKCFSIGRELIKYANKYSHPRCLVMGYWTEGAAYYFAGDIQKSVQSLEKAVEVGIDPLYKTMALSILIVCLIEKNDMECAERKLTETFNLLSDISHKSLDCIAATINGVLEIDNGQMSKGLKEIQNSLKKFYDEDRKAFAMMLEIVIAKIYMEIVKGGKSIKPVALIRNLNFVLKNVVGAFEKCVAQLNNVLSVAEQIKATGYIGQTHFQLGKIYKLKNQNDLAGVHLEKAIQIFKEVGAYQFLKQAEAEIRSLLQFQN